MFHRGHRDKMTSLVKGATATAERDGSSRRDKSSPMYWCLSCGFLRTCNDVM
jgi:hypothetical protein